MVLDIETAGALVPGRTSVRKEATVSLQRVKILRTFVGLPTDAKVGSILEISKSLAVQAKDAHKVEFIPDEKPPEPIHEATKEELKAEGKATAKEARAEARAEAKEEAETEAKADLKEAIDKSHQTHLKKK
jgi:hypothetical protein